MARAKRKAHLKHIFFFLTRSDHPSSLMPPVPFSPSRRKVFSYLTRAGVNKKQILLVQLDSCVGHPPFSLAPSMPPSSLHCPDSSDRPYCVWGKLFNFNLNTRIAAKTGALRALRMPHNVARRQHERVLPSY